MSATRFVSLLGLGFGDCGKGLFTDALCQRWSAHTIVRFNGGAQAGHNVVLPDGRHHTFAQFGSGTFQPGVATVLAFPVVVHPGALIAEQAHLASIGIEDACRRLLVDARCRVNTPFHQAAGRLRELLRGNSAHGTCGVGFGETVGHALAVPEHVLRYGDLVRPALAMQKLEIIRHDLLAGLADLAPTRLANPAMAAEYAVLNDSKVAEIWLSGLTGLLRQVPPATSGQIAERLARPGCVICEGAQGVLLDEWRGFHPHTTWSSIGSAAVDTVAAAYGFAGEVEHLGVLRAYPTRHGQGPFPTADSALAGLAEPHNTSVGWQGTFRRGHPDVVLLRYALAVVGRLDGLLVSHLDVFRRLPALRCCTAYRLAPGDDAQLCRRDPACPERVTDVLAATGEDLDHQAALTALLSAAKPEYAAAPLTSPPALLEWLETQARCKVWFGSYGPTRQTLQDVLAGRAGKSRAQAPSA